MTIQEINKLRYDNVAKEIELDAKIKALEDEKKALWIGWYGTPGECVSDSDFELAAGAKVLCEGVSADGNYICNRREFELFNAFFPDPLSNRFQA